MKNLTPKTDKGHWTVEESTMWYSSKAKKIKNKKNRSKMSYSTRLDKVYLLPHKILSFDLNGVNKDAICSRYLNQYLMCAVVEIIQFLLAWLYNKHPQWYLEKHPQSKTGLSVFQMGAHCYNSRGLKFVNSWQKITSSQMMQAFWINHWQRH